MNQQQAILSAIKSAIHSVDASAEIILFGSQARGDAHEESDWDVLVLVKAEKISYDYKRRFIRPILEVELQFSIAISPLIISKQKWQTDYQDYPLQIEIKKDMVYL